MNRSILLLPLIISFFVDRAFSLSCAPKKSIDTVFECLDLPHPKSPARRKFNAAICSVATCTLLAIHPHSAVASEQTTKPSVYVGTPAEGEAPFIELQNGVKVKDFKYGTGDSIFKADSMVQIQCSGKLLNLNGVSFYNTKNNNPDGFGAIPLTITLGRGECIPGLESGIVGMKKGGIRRIIIPPELAYSGFPDLEPRPTNANDQRALDSVVKNPRRDATILFDVSLERFK